MKKREVKAVKRLFKENIKDQEKFDIVYSKVFGAVILRYECNGKVEVAENYHDIRELSDELLFQWEYDYPNYRRRAHVNHGSTP